MSMLLTEHFPSDNEYGIPSLLSEKQSVSIKGPIVAWGSISRQVQMPGTWVFYCDDYRFERLLKNPYQLVSTGCIAVVEPNITLFEQSTKAEAIWATYQKRTVARKWQSLDVEILVDLNIPIRHRETCLLGVPITWTAFATRGYAARIAELESEIEFAHSRNPNATVMVYGGGKKVEAVCSSLPGAIYVPAHMERLKVKSHE